MASGDAGAPLSPSSSSSTTASWVTEYLELSPSLRRKGASRSIKLLVDTPLRVYADASMATVQRRKLAVAIVADIASDECAWEAKGEPCWSRMGRERAWLTCVCECPRPSACDGCRQGAFTAARLQ